MFSLENRKMEQDKRPSQNKYFTTLEKYQKKKKDFFSILMAGGNGLIDIACLTLFLISDNQNYQKYYLTGKHHNTVVATGY